MMEKNARLDNPTKGWRADLPLPFTLPAAPLPLLGRCPNFADDIYLELSGSRNLNRTVIFIFALSMFLISAFIVKIFFFDLGGGAFSSHPFLFMLTTALSIGTMLAGIGMFRSGAALPRDEPIRFNRKRRKVYVYRFHKGNLVSGKGTGVCPVIFNWEDLRAEAWSRMSPSPSGVPIFAWGVDIAVVAQGSNHVIDRFQLAGSNADGEHMWAMARAFMNQGPGSLPKYPNLPRDLNNHIPAFDPGLRLAPKVHWPDDMDVESRTGP